MTTTNGRPTATTRIRQIATAALSLYVSMIAASAAALVDTAVLGHHATAALAGLAVTTAVYGPATAAIAGAQRGVMPFVTEHQDEPEKLVPVLRNGMWLAVATGGLGGLAVAAVPWIGRIGGVPEATLDQLGAFPALLAVSTVLIAVSTTAGSALIGLGRSRLVMRAGLAGTGAAVVLSLLLVGGPGPLPSLGLPGAGIAMLASSTISAFVAQVALRRSPQLAGRTLRLGRPQPSQVIGLARVGLPLAATVLIKFAVLGVLAFSAARISTEAAAVHSVAVSLVNLMFTAAVAVGQAVVPVVAERLKEQDLTGVRAGAVSGLAVAAGAVLLLSGLLTVARGPVLAVFSADPGVRDRLVELLPLVLAATLADAAQALFGFGLIGVRRTRPSMLCFAACYGVLALLAGPMAADGGLTALWGTLAAVNLVLIAAQAWCFRRYSALAVAEPVPS
ncbi:MATE family efflux transporter [Streptomyces sp. NRRL S-337]|uniref:MATE family efflux transporter n=1 Tax=Streptomyces sp. NRRL S-337 TaxID=1463900 RepID=UPI000A9A5607|nr:MATE family efflux transporter [Streptomyces sp. NRRL S-337]